jgi:hypothetical protein
MAKARERSYSPCIRQEVNWKSLGHCNDSLLHVDSFAAGAVPLDGAA